MDMSPLSARLLTSLLEQHTGQQLSHDRSWRIEAALGPVLRRHAFGSIDMLAQRLQWKDASSLADEVVEALLNNETFFYREAKAFAILDEAVRALAADRAEKRLRIWCAGCSTGQEAYSLAMTFADEDGAWDGWTIDILGTDISRAAVERAREGLFSQFEIQRGLAAQRMIAWFTTEGDGWRVVPHLRAMTRFRQHNILDQPPPGAPFDVILCRNLLMYFAQDRRAWALDRLAEAIAPDGILLLGASETVIGHDIGFMPDMRYRGLYRVR